MTDGLCESNPEFGFNITFQAPARFLLDVPLENGVATTGDSYTGSSIFREKHDYYVEATHHLNAAREVVNLRWLKGACDLIVEGGGSLLTGDELAMALCRVLVSNKAGDEVHIIIYSISFGFGNAIEPYLNLCR